MKIDKTTLPGCFQIEPYVFKDDRGKLVKIFHNEIFELNGLEVDFKEEYYSISEKGTLRGLHFQLPPYDHVKCVTCVSGRIFDVVVDLRKESSTYKQYFAVVLDSELCNMLYIPRGFAHGFQVLSETAIFLNKTTTVYNPNNESGIKWDSCGINWPIKNPILSEKDKKLVPLNEYLSPF